MSEASFFESGGRGTPTTTESQSGTPTTSASTQGTPTGTEKAPGTSTTTITAAGTPSSMVVGGVRYTIDFNESSRVLTLEGSDGSSSTALIPGGAGVIYMFSISGGQLVIQGSDGSVVRLTLPGGNNITDINRTTGGDDLDSLTIDGVPYQIPSGGSVPSTNVLLTIKEFLILVVQEAYDNRQVVSNPDGSTTFTITSRGTTITGITNEAGSEITVTFSGGIIDQLAPGSELVHRFIFTDATQENFINDRWDLIVTAVLELMFDRGRLTEVRDPRNEYNFDRGRITLADNNSGGYVFDRGRLTGPGV